MKYVRKYKNTPFFKTMHIDKDIWFQMQVLRLVKRTTLNSLVDSALSEFSKKMYPYIRKEDKSLKFRFCPGKKQPEITTYVKIKQRTNDDFYFLSRRLGSMQKDCYNKALQDYIEAHERFLRLAVYNINSFLPKV